MRVRRESKAPTESTGSAVAREATGAAGTATSSSLSSAAGPSPRHFAERKLLTHRTPDAAGRGCFGSSVSQHEGVAIFAQHDVFGFRAAARASTAGRTCAGGVIPCPSAHASFCSSVKQQQSPAQPCSLVEHPHGWS